MSRTDPGFVDEIAVSAVDCGYCGQPRGEWCVTTSGAWATYLHTARQWPVHRAWARGYCEAHRDAAQSLLLEVDNPAAGRWNLNTLERVKARLAELVATWTRHLEEA